VFFWKIISKLETKSINKEIIDKIPIPKSFNSDDPVRLLTSYSSLTLPKDSIEEPNVSRHNKLLFKMNIIIIIIFLIGLISTIYVRYKFCGKLFDVFEVVSENILILLGVGALEYYFFSNIASKFVPVKASELPKTVADDLRNINQKYCSNESLSSVNPSLLQLYNPP
tara:strand:- start:42 stop:545 length:504 start_codon:yes stop_codon:yes gene_type:complete